MSSYKLKKWYPSLPEDWKIGDTITKCSAGYYDRMGSSKIYSAEVENNPEFWEEIFILPEKWFIVPKTAENLEFIKKYENYYKNFKVSSSLNTYSNQEFVSNGNIVKLTYDTYIPNFPSEVKEITIEQFRKYVLKEELEKDHEILNYNNIGDVIIYSVQRLSDGEIFSINDKVRFYSKITEIESIYFNEHNQLSFKVKGDRAPLVGVFMNNHPHFTKVKKLFTSKDGVEIYDGDTYYAVYNDFEYLKQEAILNFNLDNAVLRFSTKEAAEEYILMNKPCLSIEEIAPIFGMYHLDNSKTSLDRLTEKLKELVKSKK